MGLGAWGGHGDHRDSPLRLEPRVHIHFFGNGDLWFRPYGESLLANAPKGTKRSHPGVRSLAEARDPFAPAFIRGHRLRFASLHLLSMCAASPHGAARLPPDERLHSACRRGGWIKIKSWRGELPLGLMVGAVPCRSCRRLRSFDLALKNQKIAASLHSTAPTGPQGRTYLWERACSRRRPDSQPISS